VAKRSGKILIAYADVGEVDRHSPVAAHRKKNQGDVKRGGYMSPTREGTVILGV
jgi:hypothetical protein